MEKSFFFVDGTQVNKTTRKLMRSHVMKGKNAGRTIHRPSKLDLTKGSPYHYQPLQRDRYLPDEDATSAKQIQSYPTVIARNIGNLFVTLSFPLELTANSLDIISQCQYRGVMYGHQEQLLIGWCILVFINVGRKLYPSNLGLAWDDALSSWLQVLLTDEAGKVSAV